MKGIPWHDFPTAFSSCPSAFSLYSSSAKTNETQALKSHCKNLLRDKEVDLLFQQHKRRLHTWTSPDGQHQNQIDYILCSRRWRSSIQSGKTRPGSHCGSDHEFLITKFRLKLKKVGKTARPFRYDLNRIPYDPTVEVRNRFKGLDLIDRVPDGMRFVTLYRRQGSRPSPWKRNANKQKGCLGRS